jgi:hypothetical protein
MLKGVGYFQGRERIIKLEANLSPKGGSVSRLKITFDDAMFQIIIYQVTADALGVADSSSFTSAEAAIVFESMTAPSLVLGTVTREGRAATAPK